PRRPRAPVSLPTIHHDLAPLIALLHQLIRLRVTREGKHAIDERLHLLASEELQHFVELGVAYHGRAADVDLIEEEAGQLELLGGAAGRAVNDDAASRRHREDESVEVGAARAVDDH